MNDEVYVKLLEDRIDNIMSAIDRIGSRLEHGLMDYIEYLNVESNLYRDLIACRHELFNLKGKKDE